MTQITRQLPLEFGGRGGEGDTTADPTATRQESRERRVRMVEYAVFPRIASDQRMRPVFTCDLSGSGMCLGTDRSETEGTLLRVILRDVDGRPTSDVLAQVIWCQPQQDGRFRIGLHQVAEARRTLLKVRHQERSQIGAISA